MPLLRLLRRFSRSLGSSGHLALSPMKGHVTATGSGGCTQGTQQNMTTLLASSDSYLAHASPTSGMLLPARYTKLLHLHSQQDPVAAAKCSQGVAL
eukprot:scaffold270665_cov22-Tisochrysis_lutea.AAC.2